MELQNGKEGLPHENGKNNLQSFNYVSRKETEIANLNGLVVDSEDAAYNLYKDYAHRMGFSVRKGRYRYLSGSRVIRSKEFFCSKEGFKEPEDTNNKKYNKLEIRTGCPAIIRFTVQDGQWTVTHFVYEHNHELATPSKRHLLRSARSLQADKANVVNSMVIAGIRPTNVYSYMSKEAGGVENIGFTKRDCYNHVNKQKMKMIEAGDGQSLLNRFKFKASEDPMFFYIVQGDEENRLTNFFWRDSRSRIDYDCFGDVMIFDTTYRTNRYNLVCTPFVGINHHRQTIMFGCAFLLDETAASFVWLFKSFLQSMGSQSPKTIMTDQDHAISKAIEEVFPDSCHRLCLWHISKNATSHLGSLNSNAEFHALFYKCMHGCESKAEFEQTWQKMMIDYNVQDHRWLNGLYRCRKKWSTAFSIDIISFEVKSSQRDEITNNVLHGICKATSSLTDFIFEFEGLLARWRSSEAKKDFQCKQGSVSPAIKNCGILIHASEVYTYEIYKRFQKEFLDGIALISKEVTHDNSIYKFEVMLDENSSRQRTVQFDTSTMEIHCTCKKFDFVGYLCSHALRVLSVQNAKKIPQQYVLKRWTKDAKKKTYVDSGEFSKPSDIETETVFRNHMIRFAYDLIMKSQANEVTRQLCQNIFYDEDLKVEKELTKLSMDKDKKVEEATRCKNVRRSLIEEISGNDDDYVAMDCGNGGTQIFDPPCIRPKGVSNARLKGHLEKKKGKTSKLNNSKKIKQSTNVESVDVPDDTNPNYRNSAILHMSMPTNNIYIANHQNSMQFPHLIPAGNWYLGGLNLPYTNMQPSIGLTPNLSQTRDRNLCKADRSHINLLNFEQNIQESYKDSQGYPHSNHCSQAKVLGLPMDKSK